MNPVIFMPRVMPHISGGGNCEDLPTVLLVFTIVGAIVVMIGILGNILHVKFSQGFRHTPIRWDDIKPTIDNTVFGAVCGTLGFASIGAVVLIGLIAGVYWIIVTL